MDIRIVDSHLKPEYLKKYANGDTFIETGTYLGDTVHLAIEHGFKKIHSIELNQKLFENAEKMFQNNKKVVIWQGDSVDMLETILKTAVLPATFWLDAHASGPLPGGKSGGSPVIDELRLIKKASHRYDNLMENNPKPSFPRESTIFIDDRRLFGSAEWSYVKEADAIALLKEINPNYNIYYLDGHVKEDVICASIK